jgi:hypothetical protein
MSSVHASVPAAARVYVPVKFLKSALQTMSDLMDSSTTAEVTVRQRYNIASVHSLLFHLDKTADMALMKGEGLQDMPTGTPTEFTGAGGTAASGPAASGPAAAPAAALKERKKREPMSAEAKAKMAAKRSATMAAKYGAKFGGSAGPTIGGLHGGASFVGRKRTVGLDLAPKEDIDDTESESDSGSGAAGSAAAAAAKEAKRPMAKKPALEMSAAAEPEATEAAAAEPAAKAEATEPAAAADFVSLTQAYQATTQAPDESCSEQQQQQQQQQPMPMSPPRLSSTDAVLGASFVTAVEVPRSPESQRRTVFAYMFEMQSSGHYNMFMDSSAVLKLRFKFSDSVANNYVNEYIHYYETVKAKYGPKE